MYGMVSLGGDLHASLDMQFCSHKLHSPSQQKPRASSSRAREPNWAHFILLREKKFEPKSLPWESFQNKTQVLAHHTKAGNLLKVFLQFVWIRIPNSIAARARDMGPRVPPVPGPDPQGRRSTHIWEHQGAEEAHVLGAGWALAVICSQSPRAAGEIPGMRALVSTGSPWDHVCLGGPPRREGNGMVASEWAHNEEEGPQWG